MNQKLDAYRVLQVRPDAGQEEVKVAFRRLARRYHPDRANDAISNARMIEVNQAWELLGDPVRRAAYDRAHGIAPRERSEPPAGSAHANAGTAGPMAGTDGIGPTRTTDTTSTQGAATSAAPETGAIPSPPRPGGHPTGRTLPFGRYEGWTIAEVGRVEPEYLEWLVRMPIGWQYRPEINAVLAARAIAESEAPQRAAASGRRRGFLGR